jgi:hypothetical protein
VRSGASRLLSNLPEGRVLAALGETTERIALGA